VGEETHPDDDLVEVDTCRDVLFYLCNLKFDSDGFVLLVFQRLAILFIPPCSASHDSTFCPQIVINTYPANVENMVS
jgi:hypothetical protein